MKPLILASGSKIKKKILSCHTGIFHRQWLGMRETNFYHLNDLGGTVGSDLYGYWNNLTFSDLAKWRIDLDMKLWILIIEKFEINLLGLLAVACQVNYSS